MKLGSVEADSRTAWIVASASGPGAGQPSRLPLSGSAIKASPSGNGMRNRSV